MSEPDCPRCQLPKDEGAWMCDGCGYQFSQDIDGTRKRLEADVRSARTTLIVTLLVDIALVAGVVLLALRGLIYISVPLAVTVFASIGHAIHRRSVAREHLATFNRRYASLPTATVHRG